MAMTHPLRFPKRTGAALVAVLLVAADGGHPRVAAAQAQLQPAETGRATERISLTAGRSTVLLTDFDIVRLAVTNPNVADATVVAPREILIDGKASGTISLIIWGAHRRSQYDLVVEPAVTTLQLRLQALFPGENIQVSAIDEAIVLAGSVSGNEVMLRAGEIAQLSAPKSRIINMLQLPGGTQSQQVMLQVRFAEVNRRALTELGVSLFTGPTGFKDFIGRGTTQQFAAPDFSDLERTAINDKVVSVKGKFAFNDFLNLFVFDINRNVGAVIRALEAQGYFQSLAEPNLIAYNGEEASFLAGGEFPIPVAQGLTGTVTIIFKEFGVRLTFVPTIAGDVIRLKVRPEVSSLDFNNGITLAGFRVPALITRRAETDVELRDGQSFVIAGLLDNLSQEDRSAIPVLSKIPIIGNLFKSKAERKEQTELMVFITPRLVRPLDPDEVPPLPTLPGRFLGPGDDIGGQLEGGRGPVDAPSVEIDRERK
jgi:pilus assembly protein CpaC